MKANLLFICICVVGFFAVSCGITEPAKEESYPTVMRPDGFDVLDLSVDTALQILLEAHDTKILLQNTGVSPKEVDAWIADPKNQVPTDELVPLYYFPPSWETMEAFDHYYSAIFAENTLQAAKSNLKIAERNGKVSGILYSLVDGGGNPTAAWLGSGTTIRLLREDMQASVYASFENGEYEVYTLLFDDDNGWRYADLFQKI